MQSLIAIVLSFTAFHTINAHPLLSNAATSTLVQRDLRDCSPDHIGLENKWYTNCIQKEGHYFNADGSCPLGSPDDGCKSYCEVRRRAYLGDEQYGPGNSGSRHPASAKIGLDLGKSFTITKELKLDLTAEYLSVITGSLSYTYTSTSTSSVGMQYEGNSPPVESGDDGIGSRWVFWPLLIESCGTIVEQKVDMGLSGCMGMSCMNTGKKTCSGKVKTKTEVCVTSRIMVPDQSEAATTFAQRFEYLNGDVLAWENQPRTYRDSCPHGDPACTAL